MEIQIKVKTLNEIEPYQNNSRKHSDEQIKQIASSIREFGFTMPLLVSDGVIIAGHARYEAAKYIYQTGDRISLTNGTTLPDASIPVIDCSKWTDAQRRAYVLADNRLSEKSEWDKDILTTELSFLEKANFDLYSVGFDLVELDAVLGAPDDINDPAEEWDDMPEFVQNDEMPKRTIKVHFDNENDVQLFAKSVGQQITDKTKYIWFPFKEKQNLQGRRYVTDES